MTTPTLLPVALGLDNEATTQWVREYLVENIGYEPGSWRLDHAMSRLDKGLDLYVAMPGSHYISEDRGAMDGSDELMAAKIRLTAPLVYQLLMRSILCSQHDLPGIELGSVNLPDLGGERALSVKFLSGTVSDAMDYTYGNKPLVKNHPHLDQVNAQLIASEFRGAGVSIKVFGSECSVGIETHNDALCATGAPDFNLSELMRALADEPATQAEIDYIRPANGKSGDPHQFGYIGPFPMRPSAVGGALLSAQPKHFQRFMHLLLAKDPKLAANRTQELMHQRVSSMVSEGASASDSTPTSRARHQRAL